MPGIMVRIQRFSTTNGPGLRSTLFLKGCPLTCLWCHNPEMQESTPELMVYPQQCKSCGACVQACPHGVHSLLDSLHLTDRARCGACGICADYCPCNAIEIAGTRISAREAVRRLLRDRPFYDSSKGGITLSGGEPLAQFEFTKEVLTLCKAEGLHTCLDTSGWGGRAHELVDLVDLYLWDFKESDPQTHQRVTGVELAPILESLAKIDALGGHVRLRCPIIPGINDRKAHFAAIADLANLHACIQAVDLVPYHRLGLSKADAIGIQQQEFDSLSSETKNYILSITQDQTNKKVSWM